MGISASYFSEQLSFTSLKRVIRGPKKPYGDSKGVVHDPKGSYGGLVEFKGLRKKTQQTATKDSTKRHKRLNKETQKTQQIDTKDSTNGTIHNLKWRKMKKFSKKFHKRLNK